MTRHPKELNLPPSDVASYVRRLSEMRPEILQSNADIARSESVFYPLTDAEMAEGQLTEERR